MDEVIDVLDRDPDFGHFMLDGQTVVLEDYLEIRPERSEDLVRLVRAGRIAIGPWYVQPDDVLASGEALIRNLERGIELSREFGGTMRVGYLPDSFGHTGALPVVLKGFGIDTAALMRGPGKELDRSFFRWIGKDGSEILVAYLIDGYGNGADLLMDPEAIGEALVEVGARQAEAQVEGVPLLVMNGTDHRSIEYRLPEVLRAARLRNDSTIGSLEC